MRKAHTEPAEQQSETAADGELQAEKQQDSPRRECAAVGKHGNEYDCEHICHGIVGAAFKFQHRAQIVAQAHVAASQDAEYRCRIGRRHCGCQQNGYRQGEMDVCPFRAG